MAGLHEFDLVAPHAMRGKVKRTSGPLQEEDGIVVYLHLEEVEGRNRGREAPLAFRVARSLSLSAVTAAIGDVVSIEWMPSEVRAVEGGEQVYIASRFHLSRNVPEAFGKGFKAPDWPDTPRIWTNSD